MSRPAGWMTSGAFAAFCGTTKETLRHYKDIGLLVPAHRGENGYFYYDIQQFYDFCAISIFRLTGTALEDIRRCLRGQDAGAALEQLRTRRRHLERERRQLEQMEFLLTSTIQSWELKEGPDLEPLVGEFAAEHLLILPVEELERQISPGAGEDEMLMAVLERCQTLCRQYDLQADYMLGAIHALEADGRPGEIRCLYTRLRERAELPYYQMKPAGRYLYLCCRGRWDITRAYDCLTRYIRERDVRTVGPVYACDLVGFILNGEERNAASMLSVRLAGEAENETGASQ